MKREVEKFISIYNSLFEDIDVHVDYYLFDYDMAYNNNGDFIDYVEGVYKYGGCEGGYCEILFQSPSIDECMYFPVKGAVHNMAFEYELKNRIEGLDYRVLGFGMMLFYMGKFCNERWNNKLYLELFSIIKKDKLPEDLILRVAKDGSI